MFHKYTINGAVAALINLDNVVAVKAPRGADAVLVQIDGGKGMRLPYNEEAATALAVAFASRHAHLVGTYGFTDPDRDDLFVTHAHVRLDKVRGVTRHFMDQTFVVVNMGTRTNMILPFNQSAFDGLLRAVEGLPAVAV